MQTTHQSFSISFVTGSPGSGKSYVMTRDVITRLLDSDVVIYTNLPLEVEKIADHVSAKRNCEVSQVVERIKLLPREQLVAWQEGRGGPWEFGELTERADFLLDECHLYCKKSLQAKPQGQKWESWLGEVRHQSWARLVFVTQDEAKVGKQIREHAELRFELTNMERLRDPFLKIPLTYWYELRASFTREYRATIALVEYRRQTGKLRQQHVERIKLDPFWFQFYRSHEAAGGGAGKGAGGLTVVREFERRPALLPRRVDGRLKAPVWLWLMRVHWWRFTLAGACVFGGGWLLAGGGLNVLLQRFIRGFVAASGAAGAKSASKREGVTSGAAQVAENARRRADQVSSSEKQVGEVQASTKTLARVVDSLPESDRIVVLSKIDGDRAELAERDRRIDRLERQRESMAADVSISAMSGKWVWFSTGGPYKQGEVVHEGPLQGRRVAVVNVGRRRVVLDDGAVVGFGGGAGRLSAAPAFDATGVGGRAGERSVPGSLPNLDAGKFGDGGGSGGTGAGDDDG